MDVRYSKQIYQCISSYWSKFNVSNHVNSVFLLTTVCYQKVKPGGSDFPPGFSLLSPISLFPLLPESLEVTPPVEGGRRGEER